MSGTTDPHAKLTNEQLAAAFKEMGVSVSPATVDAWAAAGVPTDPHAKLPRKRIAAALTAAGYPSSAATLATLATRGGGPPFCRWGVYALYEWGSSLMWAEERLSKPRRTTSEGRELDRAAKAESKSVEPNPITAKSDQTCNAKVGRTRRKTRVASPDTQLTAAE
jgi:hypothetical protein